MPLKGEQSKSCIHFSETVRKQKKPVSSKYSKVKFNVKNIMICNISIRANNVGFLQLYSVKIFHCKYKYYE